MSEDNQTGISDIHRVVKLSTVEYGPCDECDEWRSGTRYSLTDHANHYMAEHGYRILHVGQETCEGTEGSLWQASVIVLGTTDRLPAKRMEAKRAAEIERLLPSVKPRDESEYEVMEVPEGRKKAEQE